MRCNNSVDDVSWTRDAYAGRSTYQVLNRRTVAEVQRKVIKQSGRNSALRLFHAKKDKETIAAWKVDLNRILHIFNVYVQSDLLGNR